MFSSIFVLPRIDSGRHWPITVGGEGNGDRRRVPTDLRDDDFISCLFIKRLVYAVILTHNSPAYVPVKQ